MIDNETIKSIATRIASDAQTLFYCRNVDLVRLIKLKITEGNKMKYQDDSEADKLFMEQMQSAIKSLHVDALTECDTTFIDGIEDDLKALDRCREYQKIVEFIDMKFPPDEPINNLRQYAMYMQEVIMPMLRAVTSNEQARFDPAPKTTNPEDQNQANFTKFLKDRDFNTD